MLCNYEEKFEAYFSSHVLRVHSAYVRACGSDEARKPTRHGLRSIFARPSWTSARRDLAMLFARMTLQTGFSAAASAMVYSNLNCDGTESEVVVQGSGVEEEEV